MGETSTCTHWYHCKFSTDNLIIDYYPQWLLVQKQQKHVSRPAFLCPNVCKSSHWLGKEKGPEAFCIPDRDGDNECLPLTRSRSPERAGSAPRLTSPSRPVRTSDQEMASEMSGFDLQEPPPRWVPMTPKSVRAQDTWEDYGVWK